MKNFSAIEEPSIKQEFIRKLNEIIEANLSNEQFGVDEFARETGLSRSVLMRKLKSATDKSINQFIREARLQRAMEMLRKNVASVSEIAYKVGFGSPAYFNTCFSEFFGITPGEFKKRGLNSILENGNEVSSGSETENLNPVQKSEISGISKKQVWRVILLAIPVIFVIIVLIYFFINS